MSSLWTTALLWFEDPLHIAIPGALLLAAVLYLSFLLLRTIMWPKAAPATPTTTAPKERWYKRHGNKIFAFLGLALLIVAAKFLLPEVWQWWHDERVVFFWASVAILLIAILMFQNGTKFGRIVGMAAMLLLVIGFGHELAKTGIDQAHAAQYRPPLVPNVDIRGSIKPVGYDASSIVVGGKNQLWMDVVDGKEHSPCVFVHLKNRQGANVPVRFCRGDHAGKSDELKTDHGVIYLQSAYEASALVAYMICPPPTLWTLAGCEWRSPTGERWLYKFEYWKGEHNSVVLVRLS